MDAGEQGLNGEFLMDARILFLLAPTQLICLADRLISLLKVFSPNTKDWRGFQALLKKRTREPPVLNMPNLTIWLLLRPMVLGH